MNRNLSLNRKYSPTPSGLCTPFDPHLHKLERLFTEFEETSSNFPPLKLPAKAKKKGSKASKNKKKLSATPLPSAFHRRSPQLVEDSFSPPNSFSFESGLGPGSYKTNDYLISGGKLSQAPRFFMSSIDKAEQFIKLKKRKTEDLPIIEKNKDMNQHSSSKKLENLKKSKKIKEFQIEVHKTVKKSIEENYHLQKLSNYLHKVKGIEWKLRKPERKFMKPAWTILITALTIANSIKFNIKHRKQFKKSAFRCFSLTVLISKFIGKLKRILHKNRIKNLRLCMIKRVSNMKIWMIRKKKNYLDAMVDIIESFAMSSFMTVFLVKFINNVVLIQRTFRNLRIIKRERYRSIQKLFVKYQSRVIRKIRSKSSKFNLRTLDITDGEVQGFYKYCFQKHIKDFRRFKKKMTDYCIGKEELLQNDPYFKDFDPPPPRPNFFMYQEFIENFSRFIKIERRK